MCRALLRWPCGPCAPNHRLNHGECGRQAITSRQPAPAARHIHFDRASARPGPYRGLLREALRGLAAGLLQLTGWRMEGDWPAYPKMVLVAAPHTSNWDGLYMLAAAAYYRVSLRWIGKQELVRGPFGPLMRWLGCVPVDRSGGKDHVGQIRAAFAATEAMVLAIPPEGTRSAVAAWRSGFYHMAATAGVPIVMSVLDFGSRTIRVSGALWPSGDYDADLPLIQSHYAGARGLHPDRFNGGRA